MSLVSEEPASVEKSKEDCPVLTLESQRAEGQDLQNQVEIHTMQMLIQQKYLQVSDLQTYLIEEFQHIQNCKDRNKNIQNLIRTTVIPALGDMKAIILSMKNILSPIALQAANYVKTIHHKANSLLNQKKQKIQNYETEIEKLQLEVAQLKIQSKNKQIIQSKPLTQHIKDNKTSQKHANSYILEPKSSNKSEQRQKSDNKAHLKVKSSFKETERFANQNEFPESIEKTISPKKDQNIPCRKPLNIPYKCERNLMEGYSPIKQNTKNRQKELERTPGNRKDYIKQKIEKLKAHGEHRQYMQEQCRVKLR